MNSKKFQIFVSSTFEDLKEVRDVVVRTILEMGHIPVGMEMFSAANDSQWKVIERTISESDYYVVIVAHRYGTMLDGISFTEREYDKAVSLEIPVLGFVIDGKASWPSSKMDRSAVDQRRINAFKGKIKSRMVDHWMTPDELYKKCSIALSKCFQVYPRKGWSRISESSAVVIEAPELSDERIVDVEYNYALSSSQTEYNESYLRDIRLDICGHETLGEENQLSYKLGFVNFTYLHLGNAINDRVSRFDVFDETQEMMDLGYKLYDFSEGDFNKKLKDVLGDDVYPSDLCYIEEVVIYPKFRGQHLCYGALHDIIWNFGSGCGVFAMYARPMQYWREVPADKKLGLDGFAGSKAASFSSLSKYLERMGFSRLEKGSDLLVLSTTHILPDIYKLGYSGFLKL